MSQKTLIGGQAVIEGVLMRNGENLSLAVRQPDGSIFLSNDRHQSIIQRYPVLGLPFIRGTVNLFEALIMGMKALTQSANLSAETKEEELSSKEIAVTIFFSLLFGIGLFVILPAGLTKFLSGFQGILFSLVEGILRIFILLCYILLLSRMKDIQRVFQYHGAEHKTISAYEADEELTVENIKKYSTLHPRCGTSFILFVMIVKIIAFSFISSSVAWLEILLRILMLPFIAGIAYEIIRFTGKHCTTNFFGRILIAPGLLLQKLTTREPDDQQIEAAIVATQSVLGIPITIGNVKTEATIDAVEPEVTNHAQFQD
ncbi:hypothetical protein BHU72_04865 [Desulfuribacillus stibiiarsenatis]|uniref:Metal-dependent enzyme n=1 Tax=Desulfuribacillus stibiiarsenatis TaxID=1390249 RepID=A0A1E5L5T1_9FIRM|nr:DUF1385 domain-containing protein [Desulfuribacillus stibiiarsenatis]OEH85424.1 hypothetical protein BHU72_04865 [Desulfuribacillus stibiiarsenatis]